MFEIIQNFFSSAHDESHFIPSERNRLTANSKLAALPQRGNDRGDIREGPESSGNLATRVDNNIKIAAHSCRHHAHNQIRREIRRVDTINIACRRNSNVKMGPNEGSDRTTKYRHERKRSQQGQSSGLGSAIQVQTLEQGESSFSNTNRDKATSRGDISTSDGASDHWRRVAEAIRDIDKVIRYSHLGREIFPWKRRRRGQTRGASTQQQESQTNCSGQSTGNCALRKDRRGTHCRSRTAHSKNLDINSQRELNLISEISSADQQRSLTWGKSACKLQQTKPVLQNYKVPSRGRFRLV